MKNKPIEYFQNDKEFQKCAKEWQHKLFLDDWFIKFELVDGELYLDNEEETEVYGYCTRNFENHEALIRIAHKKKRFTKTAINPVLLLERMIFCS